MCLYLSLVISGHADCVVIYWLWADNTDGRIPHDVALLDIYMVYEGYLGYVGHTICCSSCSESETSFFPPLWRSVGFVFFVFGSMEGHLTLGTRQGLMGMWDPEHDEDEFKVIDLLRQDGQPAWKSHSEDSSDPGPKQLPVFSQESPGNKTKQHEIHQEILKMN